MVTITYMSGWMCGHSIKRLRRQSNKSVTSHSKARVNIVADLFVLLKLKSEFWSFHPNAGSFRSKHSLKVSTDRCLATTADTHWSYSGNWLHTSRRGNDGIHSR